MATQRIISLILLILICWALIKSSNHSNGLNGPFQAKKLIKHCSRYFGKAVLYYSNSTCTFRIELIQDGDIHPNPGPCQRPRAACEPKRHIASPVDHSVDVHQELPGRHCVYAALELHQIGHSGIVSILKPDVRSRIRSLGIASRRKTHRGTKGGRRIRKGTAIPVLEAFCRKPASLCKTRPNYGNLVSVPREKYDKLNVHLWNCNSLRNKTFLLSDYILKNNVNIMFLTETWLKSEDPVVISKSTPLGYTFINASRGRNDAHGGVAVIYRTGLNLSTVKIEPEHDTYERVCVTDPSKTVCYVLIYRPPPSMRNGLRTSDFLDDFDELVKELTTRPFKILLLGDFNVHVDISAKPDAVQFMSSLEEAGLQQHVHGSTHKHGHTLDLVISRANNDSFVKYCRVHEKAYSDHHIVSFVLDIAKPETQYITSVSRNYRSLKKEDFETRIADAFAQFPFDSPPDDQTTFFNTAITKVLDDVCPVSERKHKLSSRPAWYTDEIYEARRIRRRLERSWRKSRKCEDYKKYLDQIHILSRLVLEAKSSYYKDQLRDADIKTVFRVLNSLLNRSPSVLPGHVSANDLANRFSAHFNHKVVKIREALSSKEVEGVPVGRIEVDDAGGLPFAIANFSEFETITVDKVRRIIMLAPSKSCSLDPLPVWMLKENIDMFLPYVMSIVKSSLNSGVFPRCLKEAIVTPIIKKSNLDRDNLGNYRPVSNLPFLSKVIEKAVMTQVSEHLESNNLNRDCQSAYRQHHSTETALLKVKNDILQAMDQKRVAFVVLLDLSAAFDSVDHEILLDRLSNVFCIKGTAKSWFDSYLSRRFSRCKVARELSTPQSLDYGVLQGSVVGPQLFSMYTHPLPDIIRLYDGVHSHSYADDVTLYAFAEPKNIESLNRALHTLSSCIDHLQKWMEANMLKLNTEKTEFLVISSPRSRQHIEDVTLAISDISIRPGLTAKNLGMQFDSALKMDSHISDLCRRLHYHLSNLARIRPFIDRKACVDAVRAIISSRLDYGNSLLYGANSSQIQRLQRVQNRAAKLIFKVRKYDHVTPLLRELHWLPIGQRIEFKMLMIVFKCLQGMAPTYLSSLIIPYQSARHGLRSSSDRTILQVPRSNSKSGDNAFMIAGPRLWNELPRFVRLSPSLEVFKKNLKTVLFNK